MYLSKKKKKKIYNINNFKNKFTNKIYKKLAETLKKYKKNKKVKNNKKRNSKKILKKNLRFAKGKEHEIPFLIKEMLDRTSKFNFNKEFYNEDLMKEIMSYIPIPDVKKAIRRSELMRSYANHLKEKKIKVEKINQEIEKNEKILIKKKEELKQLNSLGLDGPSRRTRSQGRYNKDAKIQDLEKEITNLTRSIDSMKYRLKKLKDPPAYLIN